MMTLLPSHSTSFLPSAKDPSPLPDLKLLLDPNSPVSLKEFQTLNWATTEEQAKEFLACIVNLVSYNGCYVPSAFTLLVQGFIPKQKDAGYDLESSDKISHLIHSTLQKILSLIPLSITLLGNALKDQFPHKRNNPEVLFAYLKNLLLVSYYAPSLIETLINTAVDRLIQLDVDIKLDDIQDEADELQFEVELEDVNSPAFTARKLDSMMLLMFEYLDAAFGTRNSEEHDTLFPPMNLNETHREGLFTLLLQIFDKFILSTYKSKYTQFLLFYVCRLQPEENNSYSARFMAYLFNKIQQRHHNASQLASSSYLGSFLARAMYLPPPVLREVVMFLLNWAVSYQNMHPNANPDAVVHGLFYSMCQSLYYIFCFHHKTLVSAGDESLKEGYRRITESKLNPMKVCLPSVVREFARISAEEEGWMDYHPLLKSNERVVLPTRSAFGGSNQLDVFFPFDPYLLKHSAKYITNLYLEWDGLDEDESTKKEEEEEDALDSSSDDESDDVSAKVEPEEEGEDRDSADELDQLSTDFMHFTPDVEKDLKFHFSFD